MLKVGDLESQIEAALNSTLPKAIETCKLGEFPEDSDMGKEHAKKVADTFKEMVCPQLAKLLAGAIDYYVRNAKIFGKFMILGISTVGSPTAQAQVVPLNISVDTLPTGLGGGMMPLPNMLYLGIK